MKRDIELIRKILFEVEASSGAYDPADLEFYEDAWSKEYIYYNVELMQNHGLIDATIQKGWHGNHSMCIIDGLTWDGADYLDTIRDNIVWKRTTETIKSVASSVSIETFRFTAQKIIEALITSNIRI